jgi:predicted SAM-dependent methyltransferase
MKNNPLNHKEYSPFYYKKKQYIEVPLAIECSMVRKVWQKLVGILLMPCYLIAAQILGTPGIKIHLKCASLAVRLFLLGRISLQTCYSLIFFPMDSTRYFEFHEVVKTVAHSTFFRYLDVASPRILPLFLLMQNGAAVGDILNPDGHDLQETELLVDGLELRERFNFEKSTIEMAKYSAETFDLITCISVLEHIPADEEAIKIMWSLLRPGGRLIITMPCMAQPLEQYISRYDYGVLSPGSDGYTFWQRYYDEERLHAVVFNTTGVPVKLVVYGEISYGLFYRNASMKRLFGSLYPFWRESYMMATEYRYFQSITELPGEGVVFMEFIK